MSERTEFYKYEPEEPYFEDLTDPEEGGLLLTLQYGPDVQVQTYKSQALAKESPIDIGYTPLYAIHVIGPAWAHAIGIGLNEDGDMKIFKGDEEYYLFPDEPFSNMTRALVADVQHLLSFGIHYLNSLDEEYDRFNYEKLSQYTIRQDEQTEEAVAKREELTRIFKEFLVFSDEALTN